MGNQGSFSFRKKCRELYEKQILKGSIYMMTNLEHDTLWKNAANSVPEIANSLRRANAIECMKALHEMDDIDDAAYATFLIQVLKSEGFTFKGSREI